MRWERLILHELGEAVIGLREPGGTIERELHIDHLFTDPPNIIRVPISTKDTVALFDHPLEPGRDIEDGKRDEQAVTGGVDERGRVLEVARHLYLVCVERVNLTGDSQDLRGDRIAGGVVGPHRADRVRYPDSLDRTGLVGGHVLSLDGWDTGDAERPTGHDRAIPQYSSEGGSLTDLFHEFDRSFPVAKRGKPTVHRHGERSTDLDRVQTVIVAQLVQLGDRVQVVDPAVCAERPVGFVLDARGVLAPIGAVPGVRALNYAAGRAGVVVELLSGALFVPREDRLTSDLCRSLEPPFAEVARGQAPYLVDDVHQHRRAVRIEPALRLGNVVRQQRIGKLLPPLVEQFLIYDLHSRGVGVIDDDELQSLAPENSAQSTTSRVAARATLKVVESDSSSSHKPFSGDADPHYRYLLFSPMFLEQWGIDLGELLPCESIGRFEGRSLFIDLERQE